MSYFGSIYADQELSHRAKTVYMYPQGPLQRRRHLLAQRPQDRGGLEAVPPHCAAGIK